MVMARSASSSAREDLVTSPGVLAGEGAVQLQVASAVDLPLALERVVAQPAVEGSQGKVAQRVNEALMDLVRVLAEADQVLAPFLAQRLGQDVLDRQVAALKVDLFGVP
jgi:hypothetical protein